MTLVKAQAEVNEFKKRFKWMSLFVSVCFVILAGRLFYLQIVRGGHYGHMALENIIRTYEQPAVRGTIRDARGRVLATNRPSHNLFITPADFDFDNFPVIVDYLNLEPERAERLSKRLRSFGPTDLRRFQPMLAAEDLDRDALALIETHLTELGGVHVQSIPVRTYPYGELGAHLVGYVNEITPADMELWEGEDYRSGDVVGRTGIERALEPELRGERGWDRVVVNARGIRQPEHIQQAVLGDDRSLDSEPGYDLTLTIDVGLEQIVERALRGHPTAAVVVVEVQTGRILALVSKPSFDPNMMTGGLSPEQARELLENPLLPQFNRALIGTYSPGSTWKLVTALAALEEGLVNPSEILTCGGFHELGRRAFRCSRVHLDVDLHMAIVQSCNVFFYRLAERPGMMEAISEYGQLFGFGEHTGIVLNDSTGRVESRDQHPEYRLGHALNASIGQGRTLVTVLQLAMAYAAIANHGTLYQPQVVRRIETADGDVIREVEPVVRRQIGISEDHWELVTEALIGVVADPDGTAHEQALAEVEVGGKTGTAEVPPSTPPSGQIPHNLSRWFFNRDHGWFAGFAPARDPQIAVAVLIEHGGTGGRSAAPVAMRIFRDYFQEVAPQEGSVVGVSDDAGAEAPEPASPDEEEAP